MKFPIATSLKNRAASTTKDARVLNGFVEQKGDRVFVTKRPALDSAYTVNDAGDPATGQALITVTTSVGTSGPGTLAGTDDRTSLISIADDILNTSPPKAPKSFAFAVEPSEAGPGIAISPAIVVNVVDKFGNVVTGYAGNVTLLMHANPDGGVLSGTTTVPAVSGVATFSDVNVDSLGEDYRLKASAGGLRQKVSAAFDVTAYVRFQVQPSDAQPDATITPAVKVKFTDVHGTTLTTFTEDVTISLGENPGGGDLSGTLTVSAVAGVATFSDLSIDASADGYTLIASADDIDDVESQPFGIGQDRIFAMLVYRSGSNYRLLPFRKYASSPFATISSPVRPRTARLKMNGSTGYSAGHSGSTMKVYSVSNAGALTESASIASPAAVSSSDEAIIDWQGRYVYIAPNFTGNPYTQPVVYDAQAGTADHTVIDTSGETFTWGLDRYNPASFMYERRQDSLDKQSIFGGLGVWSDTTVYTATPVFIQESASSVSPLIHRLPRFAGQSLANGVGFSADGSTVIQVVAEVTVQYYTDIGAFTIDSTLPVTAVLRFFRDGTEIDSVTQNFDLSSETASGIFVTWPSTSIRFNADVFVSNDGQVAVAQTYVRKSITALSIQQFLSGVYLIDGNTVTAVEDAVGENAAAPLILLGGCSEDSFAYIRVLDAEVVLWKKVAGTWAERATYPEPVSGAFDLDAHMIFVNPNTGNTLVRQWDSGFSNYELTKLTMDGSYVVSTEVLATFAVSIGGYLPAADSSEREWIAVALTQI